MDMFDEYKQNRKKPKEEEEVKKYEEFFAVLNNLPDELSEECFKFRVVEADDILTYLVDNLSINYDHTWVVSSDRDLYQLIDNNVSIYNIFGQLVVAGTTEKVIDLTDLPNGMYQVLINYNGITINKKIIKS